LSGSAAAHRGRPGGAIRLDQLTKPPGSLGRLEELAWRLAEITGCCPPRLLRPVIFTLAGDHGVVAEGVSAYPQIVTAQMVENFQRGGAAVNVLARWAGAEIVVADIGVAGPLAPAPVDPDRARHA
jgi:nicotinate-nucleotide--dimethylbenzimidazole phosphoribosyltransferase